MKILDECDAIWFRMIVWIWGLCVQTNDGL